MVLKNFNNMQETVEYKQMTVFNAISCVVQNVFENRMSRQCGASFHFQGTKTAVIRSWCAVGLPQPTADNVTVKNHRSLVGDRLAVC